MSELIPTPRSRAPTLPDVARTIDTLALLGILVLTVGILFVAREILVPVVIAILLSFVLSPLVRLLRQVGIGKALSVGIVVLSTFLISLGAGVILARQISDLVSEAPKYQQTVTHKVEGIQGLLANSPLLRKVNTALSDVSRMTPSRAADKPQVETSQTGTGAAADHPVRVTVIEPAPGVFDILQKVAGTAASPAATAAFVAIFIVFILMQREDLRNRFIRLVGSGDLQRTTLAMNDAARRLSRYFLAQMLLNTAFGIVVAIALSVIGVPSAVLWGLVAILMRFIPYVGSIGAAFFPVLLAGAASAGWGMAIETALFFVLLELVVGQMVEPMVYGHNTGISPIAVVLSATFWTWLWGPIGLVLSTPLTVCLVVIGRHVERLSFLDVILGDAPALTPVESFYQRVLAGDASEIADHADRFLKDHTIIEYCDQVALQALLLAQNDVRRGRLEDDRLTVIRDTVSELMEDLFDREADQPDMTFKPSAALLPPAQPLAALEPVDDDAHRIGEPIAAPALDPSWQADMAVLCISGRTPLDEAAAQLLADLLRKRSFGAHVEPAASLSNNNLTHLAEVGAKLIVLSFLDADLSVAQARFAVRRLRRRIPNVPVITAFWMNEADPARMATLREDIRCDMCVSSLAEAVDLCLQSADAKPVELAA